MTILLYIQNQQLYKTTAKVLEIVETEKGTALVLDQTNFYVQGGGQPGDQGIISNTQSSFLVTNTARNEDTKVLHYGSFSNQEFQIGEEVILEIDVEKRVLNSKNHSAGHLIDLAIKNLGLDWVPGKGFHYPAGSYVEYQLQNDQTYDLENTKTQIQDEYNLLVEKNLPIKISFDETKIYKGEMLRKVSFDGLCPCPYP